MSEPIVSHVQVQSILSKSNLPVCEYSVNPYIRVHAQLQILLCLVYEAFYRAYRAMGLFFGCKKLVKDKKIRKNMRAGNCLSVLSVSLICRRKNFSNAPEPCLSS